MKAHRRGAAVAALIFAGLVLGGCGGGPSEGGGGKLKAVDLNERPRDQVKDGGTLRLAIEQFSTQWNYHHLNGTEGSTGDVIGVLMPSLFNSDARGNLTPDTNYLLSAKLTSTSPQVATYRLNPKARWSDGKPITWSDFAAQWKALRSPQGPYQISSSTGYERVASVRRGRDDYEVVVTFSRRYSEWQGLFGSLYPADTNNDPKAFNSGWLNRIPVTAGPFKVGTIDRTSKTVKVERDPKWWGPPAKLDAIFFRQLTQDASINAFVSGEVDAVDIGPNQSYYKRVQGVKGADIRSAAGPNFRHFTINGSTPFLRDLNVRRAVAMAINRDAITRSDLVGLDWPVRTMGNHFFVNTQDGYRDNSGEIGKFNPAMARQLLDRAGWKQAGPFRQKAGRTLELRFVIPAGVPISKQEGTLAQKMLRDVGVKLDLRTVPENDFFDKYISTGNFDIAPFSWLGSVLPISSAASIYEKPVKDSRGQLAIQQNYARVGSPQIDELMASAQDELDLNKARELMNQADKLVWAEVHSLILYQRPSIFGVKAELANYGASGFKSTPPQDIGWQK